MPAPPRRNQWTIKDPGLDSELRALVARAARLQGMPVGRFIAHTLLEQSQRIIKGEVPEAGVPMVPDSRVEALEQRLAAIEARLKPWWQRLLSR